MRFRRQLVAGHAALICLCLVAGGVAVVALRAATGRLEHVARVTAGDLLAVQRLRFYAEQVVATSRGFLLTGDATSLQRFQEGTERVNQTLAELAEGVLTG